MHSFMSTQCKHLANRKDNKKFSTLKKKKKKQMIDQYMQSFVYFSEAGAEQMMTNKKTEGVVHSGFDF